jgi:hypothetical protein
LIHRINYLRSVLPFVVCRLPFAVRRSPTYSYATVWLLLWPPKFSLPAVGLPQEGLKEGTKVALN